MKLRVQVGQRVRTSLALTSAHLSVSFCRRTSLTSTHLLLSFRRRTSLSLSFRRRTSLTSTHLSLSFHRRTSKIKAISSGAFSPVWSNHMLMVQPANCPLQLSHLSEPSVLQHNPTVTMIEVSVHRKQPKKQTPGRHLPQGQVSAPRTSPRC